MTHEQAMGPRQEAAEQWAMANNRLELYGDFRVHPYGIAQDEPPPPTITQYRYSGQTFDTMEAAVFYAHRTRASASLARLFLAKTRSEQNTRAIRWKREIGDSSWRSQLVACEGAIQVIQTPTTQGWQPVPDPWRNHARGDYTKNDDGEWPDDYAHYVHGYGFDSREAAQYFTSLLNLYEEDTDTIAEFSGMSNREQAVHMRQFPIAIVTAPVYQPEPTMPQFRNKDGTFASAPPKKRSVRLYNLLYSAIQKAVWNQPLAPVAGKRKRSSPDEIMEHFKNKQFKPDLYKLKPDGIWRKSNELNTVFVDPDNRDKHEYWHRPQTAQVAFQCNVSGHWYLNSEFTKISVQEQRRGTFCEEENARSADYCIWPQDGLWHDRRPPPSAEDRQAEIRNRGDGRIPQYHAIHIPWRDQAVNDLRFGIELEIQSRKRREICTFAETLGMVGEQDGTLCRETGLEVMAKPFTYAELVDENGVWKKFLKGIQGQVRGWDAGTNYGMHVSVSRQALSKEHQIRFICFIHDSQGLCETVAGREANQWTTFKKKPRDERALIIGQLPDGRPDKYESCCVRGENRIEVRIFRSTVKVEGFMRNVEFTVSSVEFTREGKDHNQEAFLEWIRDGARPKTYPILHKFLKEKDFKIPKKEPEPAAAPEPEGPRIGSADWLRTYTQHLEASQREVLRRTSEHLPSMVNWNYTSQNTGSAFQIPMYEPLPEPSDEDGPGF